MASFDAKGLWSTSAPNISISIIPFQYVTLALVVIAILGAIVRTFIRVSKGQRRILDDFVLLPFACVCLIVSSILLHIGAPHLYRLTVATYAIQTDPSFFADIATVTKMLQEITEAQRYVYSFAALNWASIFAVKFCYLYFFRPLIDRQGAIVMYWRVAMGFTFIAGIFEICASFISCPLFGAASGECGTAYYINRRQAVEITTIVLDITTDLMIITIPIYLMHKIQLGLRQKLGIGFFLCLSVSMIIIALVRISRVHASDFDVWASFWQQIEGCVAVLMISLTAFRTVFVEHKQRVYGKGQSPVKGNAHPQSQKSDSWQRVKFLTPWPSQSASKDFLPVDVEPANKSRDARVTPQSTFMGTISMMGNGFPTARSAIEAQRERSGTPGHLRPQLGSRSSSCQLLRTENATTRDFV